MGYQTDFKGQFDLDRPLEPRDAAYLDAFAQSRRMVRDAEMTILLRDQVRAMVRLPVGEEGAYYVAGTDARKTKDILDINTPPKGQPGLWCQWVPTIDLRGIEWDGNEKFYNYTSWLIYVIEHFLKPWSYTLNGEVTWEGEEQADVGTIYVRNNLVSEVSGF